MGRRWSTQETKRVTLSLPLSPSLSLPISSPPPSPLSACVHMPSAHMFGCACVAYVCACVRACACAADSANKRDKEISLLRADFAMGLCSYFDAFARYMSVFFFLSFFFLRADVAVDRQNVFIF